MDNPALASDSSTPSAKMETPVPVDNPVGMPTPGKPRVSVDQLLLAGAHFGHLTQRWNPKMKPYIFMARNGIYLIDLQKTQVLIEEACKRITKIAATGQDILFVGTKRQARDIVEDEAKRGGCPYVTHRWLGGMLTNFSTIRRSLKTLETYEKMETDGTFEKITKKEQLSINKAKGKLNQVLGGIRDMRRIPGALFVIDTLHESIAIAEAKKLGIPIFAIVDTNVNPERVDYPIPANDDAFKSIWLISKTISDAILEGKQLHEDKQGKFKQETESQPAKSTKPRRSRRRRRSKKKPGENTGQEASSGESSAPRDAGSKDSGAQKAAKPESKPKSESKPPEKEASKPKQESKE